MSNTRIGSVQLQVREPVAGVTLDVYVRFAGGPVLGSKNSEDQTLETLGDCSGEQTLLRYRWYRASDTDHRVDSTVYCHIHPSRPAAFYCGFWKSELSSYGYLFPHACHCSLKCFQEHFQLQRRFWEKAQSAKKNTSERALSTFTSGRY